MKRTLLAALTLALAAVLGFASVANAPAASGRGAAWHKRGGHKPGGHNPTQPKPTKSKAAPVLTRYALVHGCYELSSTSGQPIAAADAPYRMQATALGRYLIYGVHGDFLGHDLKPAAAAAPDTVWQVNGDSRRGFAMVNLGGGAPLGVSFKPAAGCAVYPEGDVGATGPAFTGASPEAAVNGTIDAHTHVTAFEFLGGDFHCGRPWHPFGIPYALGDCAPNQQGTNGQVESFLDYGGPAHKHDTRGWPTFHDWPSPTDLAEEGDYYTGLERAWKAGLRVMVTQLVDNEALCQLMSKRHNPCNDMQSVVIQARDLRNLQDYIDAQSGGPGKGFFRIVTDPFQARQVINQGKLAVVEGIEVSHLFNCGEYLGVPKCDQAQIDAGLKQVRALGVSTFFPIHKFDNAFGGTKMDAGELGVLVNGGNHLETGHFWDVKTCTGPEHDSTQLTALPGGGPTPIPGNSTAIPGGGPTAVPGGGLTAIPGGALTTLLNGAVGKTLLPGLSPSSQLPVYPPPPHCNTRGLTSLGAYLINQMIRRHFIVELDHMDVKTADATLSILEAHHYSGVVSAHSWDSPQENPRIYNLGGFVTPIAGASPAAFISQWKASLTIRNPRFYNGTGFGYGADMNGLAEQSQPDTSNPIPYPFKSFDGRVTFIREQWGQRVFDLNRDGVANYGMYADWLAELRSIAGQPLMNDMFGGAEAYLQMWERAQGVPATSCRPARGRLAAAGLASVRLGATPQSVLYAAGQPTTRPGRSYRWCVSGAPDAQTAAVFGRRGRVVMVASSSHQVNAGRLYPGSQAGRTLRQEGTRLASGLWLSRRSGSGPRFAYRVAGGRIASVAVVAAGETRSAKRLRDDLRAAGL